MPLDSTPRWAPKGQTEAEQAQECAIALMAMREAIGELGEAPMRTVFFVAVPFDEAGMVRLIGAGEVIPDVAHELRGLLGRTE